VWAVSIVTITTVPITTTTFIKRRSSYFSAAGYPGL
jgi:hypothetical protein